MGTRANLVITRLPVLPLGQIIQELPVKHQTERFATSGEVEHVTAGIIASTSIPKMSKTCLQTARNGWCVTNGRKVGATMAGIASLNTALRNEYQGLEGHTKGVTVTVF